MAAIVLYTHAKQVRLMWAPVALSPTGIVIEFIHNKPPLPRQSNGC